MLATRLLLVLCCVLGSLCSVAPAQGTHSQETAHSQGQEPHGRDPGRQAPAVGTQERREEGHAQGHGHPPVKPTMEMANDRFFKDQYQHSVPYVIAEPELSTDPAVNKYFQIYNVNKFQWIVLAILLVLFLPVVWSFRSGSASWPVRVLRGWCLWIRDEMVYAVMGKEEGRKFAPFFVFLFFFIAGMNCIGLIPSTAWFSTYTATGTPYVTAALAIVTLAMMVGFGMKHNGVFGYIKGLLPHGLPAPLIPLMLVVELIGVIVKPFALTIRLFANMLAGHLVIASLIGLIFLFAKMQEGAPTSYATAIAALAMAIFIFIIEAFVTLLQAYIFTYLSIIFVQQAIHQEH